MGPTIITTVTEPSATMTTVSAVPWRALERWSAPAFLFAGVLWLGDAALLGLEHLQIYTHGLLNGVLISGAMLSTVIGLLGIVPRFADERPFLPAVTALIGGVAVITMGATVLWTVGALLLAGISPPPGITAVPTVVAFGWFGVAILWTDVPSRIVGLLLVALVAPWVGIAVVMLLGAPAWITTTPQWSIAVVVGLYAVLSIAIGYVVRTTRVPLDPSDQPVDSLV